MTMNVRVRIIKIVFVEFLRLKNEMSSDIFTEAHDFKEVPCVAQVSLTFFSLDLGP
jgi:hypothetical protein